MQRVRKQQALGPALIITQTCCKTVAEHVQSLHSKGKNSRACLYGFGGAPSVLFSIGLWFLCASFMGVFNCCCLTFSGSGVATPYTSCSDKLYLKPLFGRRCCRISIIRILVNLGVAFDHFVVGIPTSTVNGSS